MPKRSHRVLQVKRRVKRGWKVGKEKGTLNQSRKKKSYAEVAKNYNKNKSIHEIVKKEKKFILILLLLKVMAQCMIDV